MQPPGAPRPSISVFFPCYNDERTIAGLVREADAQLRCATDDYEIIVVNDGSRDGSAAVLADLRRIDAAAHGDHPPDQSRLRRRAAVGIRERRRRSSSSTPTATASTTCSEIPIMLVLLTADTDFVNGMKMARSDPAYRVFIGNLHKFVTRWAFWLPIDDVDCDYRLIRRSVLDAIELRSNSGSICVELVKRAQRAGAQFRQVSVRHYSRQFGSSQFFRPGRILRTYADLARMWVTLMLLPERPEPLW